MTSISSLTTNTYYAESTSSDTDYVSDAMSDLDSFDFLTLFVAEIENQDPLEPMSNTEVTAQLCSYSQLEQQQQTNDYLTEMISQQTSLLNSQAVNLIGKEVTVEGDELTKSDGETVEIEFDSDSEYESATVSIYDQDGNLVTSIDVSGVEDGRNTVSWDGTDAKGNSVDDGTYTYSVAINDEDAENPEITTYSNYEIVGMLSGSNETYLLTEDGKEISYSDVLEVHAV